MRAIQVTGLLLISAFLSAFGESQPETLPGRWEELPLPMGRQQYISSAGLEPGGVLWITTSTLLYWDGQFFRFPVNEEVLPLPRVMRLHGGPDRGLYAAQMGVNGNQGELYRLVDGEASYMADFEREVSRELPGLCVSKSGQLFNWGNSFLEAYVGGKWKRIEASLDQRFTLVFDTGDKVHFYYNGNLYSADKGGNVQHRQIPAPIKMVPGQRSVYGTLWGENTMAIYECGGSGFYVYCLDTGEPAIPEKKGQYLGGYAVYDMFRSGDGSMWALVRNAESRRYGFYRVTLENEAEYMSETEALGLEGNRRGLYPECVLNASDGSVWFGLADLGIVRYRDRKMQDFGWKEGIGSAGFPWVFEDARGNIYAVSLQGVWRYSSGVAPGESPTWVQQWEEYRLAGCHPVRDSGGNIWMFLSDQPGKISRWDGNSWTHAEFPYRIPRDTAMMWDDQGHIFIEGQYSNETYDVSVKDVEPYVRMGELLVSAVKRGAKRIWGDRYFQGCVVLEDGTIWWGHYPSGTVSHFDGERWHTLSPKSEIHALNESVKYGILLNSGGGKFLTYEDGQFVEIPVSRQPGARWLWGSKWLQPYEEELVKRRPGEYIAVEMGKDDKYHLLEPRQRISSADTGEGDWVLGEVMPQHMETLTPGVSVGFWNDPRSSESYRFFGSEIVKCDYQHTPLLGKEYSVIQILEDRAHNLWFYFHLHTRGKQVFMKRLSDFELRAKEIPAEAKRSVTVRVEPFLGGEIQPDATLFWRVNAGPWQGGLTDRTVTVDFFQAGKYEFEFVGMDPLGGTTPNPLRFSVDVRVTFPETNFAAEGPYEVEDILWQIPAKAVPSQPGETPTLAYCIKGGPWQFAYKGEFLSFGDLEPGDYRVKVAAVEAEKWYDPIPLMFEVTYAPDYERIVDQRLATMREHARLSSRHFRTFQQLIEHDSDFLGWGDSEEMRAAMAELKMAGPSAVPILEKRLAKAREEAALVLILQRLLDELRKR